MPKIARTYTVLITLVCDSTCGPDLPGTQPLADHICRGLEEGVREKPGYIAAVVDAFIGPDLLATPSNAPGVKKIKAMRAEIVLDARY
jgi:hypothetical protein